MLRSLKSCFVLLAAAGLQSASAFSLLGPPEGFQVDVLGYSRLQEIAYPSGPWFIETNPEFTFAPKNLGEEYRWSAPVLYYAYDANFLDYFGSNGVSAVDSAIAILNRLTNVDSYSPDLSEFPTDESRFNYTAAALHLFDLKSAALEMLVTRLGLADPERWTWCLRSRQLRPGASCPFYDFTVIQRNFDPVTFQPSKYVNGNLFTYDWLQFCPPNPFGDRSDMVEFLVDPLDTYESAVASPKVTFPNIQYYGLFHTDLTRDDVGGLRYLYSSTNRNVEVAPPDAVLFDTNRFSQLLVTSNLTLLAAQALTNTAAALQALYPGLIITSSTNTFAIQRITNITAYFTNFPWDPPGAPTLAFATNITLAPQILFHHTFANVATIQFINGNWVAVPLTDLSGTTNRGRVTFQTISVANAPWAPAGSTILVTNITSKTFFPRESVGEFFILPPNFCDIAIIAPLLTNVIATTNILLSVTNLTSTNGESFTQTRVDFFTNRDFVIFPVLCVSNSVSLRQGLQKISFVRRDFDSLLGRFFQPVTNDYTMTAVTNSQPFIQRFRQRRRGIRAR